MKHSEEFQCDQCNFLAKDKVDLQNHRRYKHEPQFPCNMCTYKANHNPDLKRHLRVMHPYKRSVFFNQTRRKNTTMTEKANINLNKEELDNQDTNIFEDEKHGKKSNRY